MATTLYPRSGSVVAGRSSHGTNRAKLNGSTSAWQPMSLMSTRGGGAASIGATPVAGPTNGVEFVSGQPVEWISPPLAADVTISGTITLNLRGSEADMNANAAINAIIERVDHLGQIVSTIAQTARVTELGTTESAANFTVTPTSTAMNAGDRIRLRVYIDDAGTMGALGTCFFFFSGPTGGASGDSFITFTETFSLIETDPTGTQIFLTDTASAVSTASVDREAWTSRGAGVQTDVTNTQAGWVSPIQVTDTAGGTVVDWFTRPLVGFTLSGAVLVNMRGLQSSTAANAALRTEIAVVAADGTSPTVWGATTQIAELGTTEGVQQVYVSGDDLVVATGKRIRIRVYLDDAVVENTGMGASLTATLFYAGTSGGASGDSYVTFTQTLTESGGSTTVTGSLTANAVLKRNQTGSFTADASVFRPGAGTLTADAVFRRAASGSLTADAFVRRTISGSFTANAVIARTIVNEKATVTFLNREFATDHHNFRTNTTYASLVSGTYIGSGNNQSDFFVGQRFTTTYFSYESFLSFDTSSIPADASITSASLAIDGKTDNSSTDFTVEAYDYPWTTGTEFLKASDLAALTLRATFGSAGYSSGLNTFTDVALTGSVALGSITKYVLASSRYRTGSTPTVDEYIIFSDGFGDPYAELTVAYQRGTPFTADAVIFRSYPITANAVLKRNQTGSFTADAVLAAVAGTITRALTADAVIRKARSGSLTADAWLRRTQTGSLSANAVIVRFRTGTLTADSVIKRAAQSSSFTADAWIYSPRADPDGEGAPGETPLVSIVVAGVDITAFVEIKTATFTMLVNGAPGTFRMRVKDVGHVLDFTSGAEVTVDIDGRRKFGGYLITPSRGYAFVVDDTTVPSSVARYWTLEGVDYNILFQKRALYDKANPADVTLRSWPTDVADDVVIKYVVDHYTDIGLDGVTYGGVTHVGTPNPDKVGVVGSGGLRFYDAMREINSLINGVFYIDQYKVLNFVDVDTPTADYRLSDHPDVGAVGYRELVQTESAAKMLNDAMVWGAGMGSSHMVFSRVQDTDSINAHKRWQYGEMTTQMFRQASVEHRADSIVNGSPQSKRGGKDDQESWKLVTFNPSFEVGQKVEIESEVFGKSDVVPIRRMTLTFPTRTKVKLELVLSHEIDEPWNIFEFWFPDITIPTFSFDGFEVGGSDPGPPQTPCDSVYAPWATLGEWEWVTGQGDGVFARKGLTPGWDTSGGSFWLNAAADAPGGGTTADSVSIRVTEAGAAGLFAYLRSGPFTISGSFQLPANPGQASNYTVTWSMTLLFGSGAFITLEAAGGDSLGQTPPTFSEDTLARLRVNEVEDLYASAATETLAGGFSITVTPTTVYASVAGHQFVAVPSAGIDISDLIRISISMGEGPIGSSDAINAGVWSTYPFDIRKTDGSNPPWCIPTEMPQGNGVDDTIGDGAETTFQLRSAYVTNSTRVYINGLFQRPGHEYTESAETGEITFATAPPSGSLISVHYFAIPGLI